MFTERLQQMVMEAEENTSYSEEESAMAATSESDSLGDRKISRRGRERKPGRRLYHKAAAPSNSPSLTRLTRGAVHGAYEDNKQGEEQIETARGQSEQLQMVQEIRGERISTWASEQNPLCKVQL